MFVSVTRLRIRSIRFLPFFFISIFRTSAQVQRMDGLIEGELLVDRKLTFWTMTAWNDERAMIAYRNSGSHRAAMPRLLTWCDEAAAVHWVREGPALPGWVEASANLRAEGIFTKVRFPSPNQSSRDFADPRLTFRRKIAAIASAK
jgi:hypothetical protein